MQYIFRNAVWPLQGQMNWGLIIKIRWEQPCYYLKAYKANILSQS